VSRVKRIDPDLSLPCGHSGDRFCVVPNGSTEYDKIIERPPNNNYKSCDCCHRVYMIYDMCHECLLCKNCHSKGHDLKNHPIFEAVND